MNTYTLKISRSKSKIENVEEARKRSEFVRKAIKKFQEEKTNKDFLNFGEWMKSLEKRFPHETCTYEYIWKLKNGTSFIISAIEIFKASDLIIVTDDPSKFLIPAMPNRNETFKQWMNGKILPRYVESIIFQNFLSTDLLPKVELK